MAFLSPELVAIVLTSLSKADLARVALASKSLNSIAQPVLYNSITLYDDRHGVKSTFQLLVRDHALALRCTRLSLHTTRKMTGPTWLNFDSLRQLKNLRHLELSGIPFLNDTEQQQFTKLAGQSWTQLAQFGYSPGPMSYMHLTFPGGIFELSGLASITWNEEGCFSHSAVLSLVASNIQTLTELILPCHFDDFACEASSPLWSLHFPHLRVFHLGYPLDPGESDIEAPLTRFLVAHPSVEDLALGFSSHGEWAISLSSEELKSGMLPRLCSLHANVVVLTCMLRGGIRSLRHLKHLSTGHGLVEYPADDLENFVSALENVGGMPRLTALCFEPGESLADHVTQIKDAMSRLAQSCPAIDVWSGSLPMMSAEEMGTTFSHFSLLKQLEIPPYCISGGIGTWSEIASKCKRLQRIVFKRGSIPERVMEVG